MISTFPRNLILVFVSQKISKTVRIIAKAHYYLSSKSFLTLYYSPVNPCVTYCNVAWSSTYYSNLKCICLLQKRIVWLISKTHYVAYTTQLFSKLKVLDIYSINSFSVATFMYALAFHKLFLSSNQVHRYEILLASQYRPHFCGTNIKRFSILHRRPTIWNSLPVTLISSSSIFVFKNI